MSNSMARAGLVLLSVAVVTFIAWFAVAAPYGDGILSPGPWSTLIPALYLRRGLDLLAITASWTSLATWVGCSYGAAFLIHLVRGADRISRLSAWVFIVLAVLDLGVLGLCFQPGVEHQGLVDTLVLVAMNIAVIASLAAMLRRNRRKPSFRSNYGFHVVLALWLCWFAFPWLGETP